MIKLKNVYDIPSKEDGERFLIERLWPVEVDVYLAKIDHWLKNIAPSYALLEWFHEHPKEWTLFKQDYLEELKDVQKQALMKGLRDKCSVEDITLLYREASAEKSAARIIYEWIENLKSGVRS